MIAVEVVRKDPVADGVVLLTLRDPAGAPLPEWEPGAHVDVELRPDLVRQYSLCGDVADRSSWRLAVLHEPAGRGGSAFVHDRLSVADRLCVSMPRNNFGLVAAPRYLFVAGGVGITPLLPMIAAVSRRGADWRLLYGGRTRASMAFLPALAAHGDRVSVRPQDETGLLDLSVLSEQDSTAAVYCCGPEPLLAAVEQRCPPEALHVERFAPKPVSGESFAAFEVELARSGRTLEVPADRSILEVLTGAGVAVLSSCEEGTCGTCETDVLGGTPEHRDSLLTEDERAAGETMMICVSRSAGGRLVLDL
ncbi:MAG: 2Fe-2S iron-sulfur cluster binding domain-containing protein [Actinophytocola sp.]|uniref:PDR/VanB family oxidoreductase n=1 Tax=Actinophytocola sp. TaxID=1872138 RepID=UPI00132802C9|nr:PDR/VanB family oxidoreductase [Actinophytocola sp.]MPZ79202.1 2Fe-2S iron-sulfur cluster binding domain-containing protein [Actinophytocola sp.]